MTWISHAEHFSYIASKVKFSSNDPRDCLLKGMSKVLPSVKDNSLNMHVSPDDRISGYWKELVYNSFWILPSNKIKFSLGQFLVWMHQRQFQQETLIKFITIRKYIFLHLEIWGNILPYCPPFLIIFIVVSVKCISQLNTLCLKMSQIKRIC